MYLTTVIDIELILVSTLLYNYKNIALLQHYGGVLIVAALIVGLIYIPKVFKYMQLNIKVVCYNWK